MVGQIVMFNLEKAIVEPCRIGRKYDAGRVLRHGAYPWMRHAKLVAIQQTTSLQFCILRVVVAKTCGKYSLSGLIWCRMRKTLNAQFQIVLMSMVISSIRSASLIGQGMSFTSLC